MDGKDSSVTLERRVTYQVWWYVPVVEMCAREATHVPWYVLADIPCVSFVCLKHRDLISLDILEILST